MTGRVTARNRENLMHHITHTTSRTHGAGRILRSAAAASALALLLAACGGDSSNEDALERLIESETGEDIDLDLDGDGGFSLESDDGNFSINIDDEGNVQFESDEGSGVFDADGDGGGSLTFDDGDGESGSIDFDTGDDGSFTITGEDGEVLTGDIGDDDGDGSFSVTGEDGNVFESGPGFPDRWPDEVPRPEGLSDMTGTLIADAETFSATVAGTPDGDPNDYLERYVAALVAAGFDETSRFSNEGSTTYFHERDGIGVTSSFTDLGSSAQVVISTFTN